MNNLYKIVSDLDQNIVYMEFLNTTSKWMGYVGIVLIGLGYVYSCI